MTDYTKITKMFGAQTYGIFINSLDKFLSVPLLFYFWSADLVGEWLILRAIPNYLSIVEFGLSASIGNKMVELYEIKEFKNVSSYYSSGVFTLWALSIILIIVTFFIISLVDFRENFNIVKSTEFDVDVVVISSILYCIFLFQTQMASAGYRVLGLYSNAAMITYHIRLIEFVCLSFCIVLGGGVAAASITILFVRFFGAIFMDIDLARKSQIFRPRWCLISIAKIRDIAPNSIGFFGFPFSQMLNIQGSILIIAAVSSPAVVAAFNILRTLVRLIVQFGTMVNKSVWPEMTRAALNNNSKEFIKLANRSLFFFFSSALLLSFFLLNFGERIVDLWTNSQVSFDSTLFCILTVAAFANGLWMSAMSVFMALDKHKRLSLTYLALTLGFIGTAFLLKDVVTINSLVFILSAADVCFLAVVLISFVFLKKSMESEHCLKSKVDIE